MLSHLIKASFENDFDDNTAPRNMESADTPAGVNTMPAPTTFRAVGDRAAARLRKRAEWAAAAAQHRTAHDLAHEQWITGALAPYRITGALDSADLYGRGRRQCMRGAGTGGRRMGGRHPLPLVRAAPRPGHVDSPIPGLVRRTRRRRGPRPLRDTTMWCHITKAEQPRW